MNEISPLPDLGNPITLDSLPEPTGQLTFEGYKPEGLEEKEKP